MQVLDLTLTDLALKGFNGGFSDGTYGNSVPYHNGTWFDKVTRWALASFEQAKAMDLTMTDPALKGFQGGFNDGTYGYAMPFNIGAYFGKMTRWALAPFGQGQVLDLAAADPAPTGFGVQDTYQRWLSCCIELFSHYFRRGSFAMDLLLEDQTLRSMDQSWLLDTLFAIEGDCTCCFRKHAGTNRDKPFVRND